MRILRLNEAEYNTILRALRIAATAPTPEQSQRENTAQMISRYAEEYSNRAAQLTLKKIIEQESESYVHE